MDVFITWLEENINSGPSVQVQFLTSLAIVVVLWIVYRLVARKLVERIEDPQVRFQWQKTANYIFFILGALLIGAVWIGSLSSFITFLGLLSAGLAIALKDPLTNVMAWAFIVWRRPFQVGDRIEVGEYAGDVIDLRVFQFALMEIGQWVGSDQSTGRILHVPNEMIFTDVLANYTKGSDYIWNEIPVLITFESDWKKAKGLLNDVAQKHTQVDSTTAEKSFREATRKYMLRYGKLSSTVYTSVKDSGVLLTIRYLCEPRERRNSEQEIWESILDTFALHPDIDFAYPTRRFYDNIHESKLASQGTQSE